MALIRKTIRNDVADALRSFNVQEVYTRFTPDPENAESFITVSLTEGETEYDDLQYQTRAELTIGLHKKNHDTQDELDDWAETIYPSLNVRVSSVLTGIIPSGFEFVEDDQSEYSALLIKFIVVYKGN